MQERKQNRMGKRVSSPKWTVFACEAIRLSAFSAWTWSHGRRDPCLLVRNPFPDEWGVAENAPSELRHKETMESCYPAKNWHRSRTHWANAFLWYNSKEEAQAVATSLDGLTLPGWWRPFKAELAWTDPNWNWLSGCKYWSMCMWGTVGNW